MKALLLTTLLFFSNSVFGAATLNCEIQDENVNFEFRGILSHSIPNSPHQTSGSLTFQDPNMQIFNQESFADVMQFWQDGQVMNILIYEEPETMPFFSRITLEIRTTPDEHFEFYHGRYKINIYRGEAEGGWSVREGNITCQMG